MSGKKGTNEAAVDRFVGYFADQLRRIESVESHHYRKTLFVARAWSPARWSGFEGASSLL